MEGINEGIKDLKFDIQDNIYGLTEDGIYKCLATNTKFIKMKVLTNSINYLFTNLKIDESNNVYVWSSKDGVYRCLSDNIEFNKIGGIHLKQQHEFEINLLFSQNNVYAIAIKILLIKKFINV